MIKKIFCLSLLLWALGVSHAQVGLTIGYSSFDKRVIADNFDFIVRGNDNYQTSGLHLSADYWFRLKQKRLEFMPTVYYTNHYQAYDIKNYGFQFRTTVYPFDFDGDCNCPTFSKENELLKKGFFIRLSPGIGHWSTNVDSQLIQDKTNLDTWAAELSGGMGLDIGLTNLLTISPEVRYRRTFKAKWNSEADNFFRSTAFFEAAIRIGLRFDKKNYGFKRPRRRR